MLPHDTRKKIHFRFQEKRATKEERNSQDKPNKDLGNEQSTQTERNYQNILVHHISLY